MGSRPRVNRHWRALCLHCAEVCVWGGGGRGVGAGGEKGGTPKCQCVGSRLRVNRHWRALCLHWSQGGGEGGAFACTECKRSI